MMTFGLSRPVFSFGLLAAGTLFITTGQCAFEAEDARLLTAERLGLAVEDVRIVTDRDYDRVMDVYQPRILRVWDFRNFDGIDDRTLDLYNTEEEYKLLRTFTAEDNRTYVTERHCDADDSSDI
jgi:hypothetical protein